MGTLYQYFPHREALLYRILLDHFDAMATAFERLGARSRADGEARADAIAVAIADAYVDEKLTNQLLTRALYRAADLIDQVTIPPAVFERMGAGIAAALRSVSDIEIADPHECAATLLPALAGLARNAFALAQEGVGEVDADSLRRRSRALAAAWIAASGSQVR